MFKTIFFSLLLCSGFASAAAIDPTQPPANLRPAAQDDKAPAPVLQAILRSAQGSRAVIAGRALRVGEEHAGPACWPSTRNPY